MHAWAPQSLGSSPCGLQKLRAIALALQRCGPRAAFYLAAAVSDFYIPWPDMVGGLHPWSVAFGTATLLCHSPAVLIQFVDLRLKQVEHKIQSADVGEGLCLQLSRVHILSPAQPNPHQSKCRLVAPQAI